MKNATPTTSTEPISVTHVSWPILIAAWGVTLLASNLPTIFWQLITHAPVPVGVLAVQEAVLLLIVAVATRVRLLRPLRGYVVTLLVVSSAFGVYDPLSHTALWHSLDAHTAWWQDALLRQVPTLLGVLVLGLTLLGAGLSRTDLRLTASAGDAVATRDVVIVNLVRRPWRRAGVRYAVIITGLFALFLFRHTALPPDALQRWLVALPAVVLVAGINTLSEEFQYRQVPLARLQGVISVQQSLWLTAVLFGISHYYGNPSGVAGVIAATWFGYLQAKSMTESQGSTWAWLIHFAQDFVIFSFLAL